MAHIFFIDPLEKLNIKKDSTLMMALTFQHLGHECYLLFEKDFYITNDDDNTLKLFTFKGEFKEDGCYLDSFETTGDSVQTLFSKDVLHMRIDPPYDSRYQRYLWMLDFLETSIGLEVLNHPLKIMKYNEKLAAYKNLEYSHLSYIGSSEDGFVKFKDKLLVEKYTAMILKPLDLFSGIGVEKVDISDPKLMEKFTQKVEEFQGAIVAQPFIEDVYNGELRSIYFDGEELGTILKKPNKGEFLANIAQGAQFEKTALPAKLKETCDKVAKELYDDGVRFIAFDLLGGALNEINITCPGLLVEVSYACKKNLTYIIASKFKL
jgi:glutathione synthase